METTFQASQIQCLNPGQLSKEPQAPGLQDAAATVDRQGEGRKLVCVRCHGPITTTSARTSIEDQHEHVRINPHDIAFRFGCFSTAPGCVPVGKPQHYFSWFSGFSWQLEHCAACGLHMGWVFRGEPGTFHGLILNRLTEADSEVGGL